MLERPLIPMMRIGGWTPTVKHVFILLVVIVYVLSFLETGTNPKVFIEGLPMMGEFAASMFPPHFIDWDAAYYYNREADLPFLLDKAVETIQMAVVGTFLAVIFGFLLAMFAARNISPNVFVYQVARTICDSCRGISELVWALLFVAMLGLGPFTGILALAVHNTGALGKYFSEAIEAIDVGVLEAVEASGATRTQVFFHGVMPALGALFMSYILYYFEHNLRQATVLGVVGAGGIGTSLLLSMTYFNFDKVLTIVMIMLCLVIITDRLSGFIRKRLLGGEILTVA